MKTSEQIDLIAAAMAKAQAALRPAVKDSTNPAYRSKYADLSSVWAACREALPPLGLSVWQDVFTAENGVAVTTRIAHSSGQWVECGPLVVPVQKHDAHGVGSATSYGKRYGLAAAVGVVAEDDDDGNAAAAAKPTKAIPANIEGQDIWAGYDAATKDMLESVATSTINLARDQKGDAHGYLEEQGFDQETKLALWTRLPSDVRAYIKKQAPKASLATQA